MQHVDLTPLVTVLQPLMYAALTAAASTLVAFAFAHWPVLQKFVDQTTVDRALGRAGGIANSALAGRITNLGFVTHDQAVAEGAQYLISAAPDALKRLNITPDHIDRMVTGELGTLLDKSTHALPAPAPQTAHTTTETTTTTP
jgi:hypothetical protein